MSGLSPLDKSALAGRAVLVTGASSGIGACVARFAAESGAQVAIQGRDRERLQQVARSLAGEGHGLVAGDLTAEDVGGVVKEAVAQVGPLSGFVHAAGVHSAKPLRALRAGDLDATMRVNVTAGALLLKSLRMPAHRAEDVAAIFVSSVAGLVGQPGVVAYAASKGAVVAMARSLAVELAPEGIRVNCVAPGMVRTPMSVALLSKMSERQRADIEAEHPLGIGEVQDVAAMVTFLLTPAARWITGSVIAIDGGLTAR